MAFWRKLLAGLGLGASLLGGQIAKAQSSEQQPTRIEQTTQLYNSHPLVMETLRTNNPGMIKGVNGVFFRIADEAFIKILAGSMMGTVRITGNGNNLSAEGTFSEGMNPEVYRQALRLLDADKDNIISPAEASRALSMAQDFQQFQQRSQ